MEKIIKIEKETNNKYLNLYKLTYKNNNNIYDYFVASRREIDDLGCKKEKVDAVRVVPYFIKNNKIYVVLINEYRHAINKSLYGTVAGLVENNETTETAITREIEEEIGASVVSLKKVQKGSYSSVGMSDENIECFYANVEINKEQKLDSNEHITLKIIEFDKLIEFIEKNSFDLQSALLLKMFYFETQYKGLNNI